MPELPEVQTTVNGITTLTKGLTITDVWTDYGSDFHTGKDNIKNPKYFKKFAALVRGKKITGASRRGKLVLIHLAGGQTILTHMKMTGHYLYGRYEKKKVKTPAGTVRERWLASDEGPLRDDPFNAHIHLVFSLSSGAQLAFSDTRKFAKITLIPTDEIERGADMRELGPDPLNQKFTLNVLKAQIAKRSNTPIKQVLMDQTLIAGIGNIYSDEILFASDIHPLSVPAALPPQAQKKLHAAIRPILIRGINFGGDSMSDYRNLDGIPGKFQNKHMAYRRTGKPCLKRGCKGTIERRIIGGRSSHFCDTHQILYTSQRAAVRKNSK